MVILRRRRRRLPPRGATTVEFALTAPILFFFIFAALEFSRAHMIYHTCENAAYEGARRGIVPGATQQNVIDTTHSILNSVSVTGLMITVTPTNITSDTTEVTVVISVPIDSNSWVTPLFFLGKTASVTCTLQREKYSNLL